MRYLARTLLTAAAIAGWIPAVTSTEPPTGEQLQAWISQLDADDYAAREKATRRLTEASVAAIDALAGGIASPSPEVAWRASESLQQIAIQGDEPTLNRVVAALDRLSREGKPGLSKVAQELRGKQARLRHDRAAAQIRSLGGKLAGGEGVALGFGGDFGGGFAVIDVMPGMGMVALPADVVEEAIPAEEAAPERPAVFKALDAALERFSDLLPVRVEGEPPPALLEGDAPAELPDFAPPAPVPAPVPEPPQAPAVDAGPVADPAPPAAEAPIAEAPALAPPAADAGLIEVAGGELMAEVIIIDGFFAGGAMFGGGMAFPGMPMSDVGEAQGFSNYLALDQAWRGGDEGLKALRDLPSIQSLSIEGAKLTDAALEELAALPNLQHVSIHGTKFSGEALRKFREQRPAARVIARSEAMLGIHADLEGSCVLTGVYPGSGAFEAGLQPGDEIVAIDGHKVRDFSDLTIAVYPNEPGAKLKVEYLRDAKRHAAEVVLKARNVLEKRD